MLQTERFAITGPGLECFDYPADSALFVVGDVHGQANALRRLLDGFGTFPTGTGRRTLIFLGDLIDRGPSSLGALEAALSEAQDRAKADEVVHLPGNHDLLLADTLEDAAAVRAGALPATALGRRQPAECWMMNGGAAFLDEVLGNDIRSDLLDALARFEDRLPHPGHETFPAMVRSWPSHVRRDGVLCVHAGLAPKHPLAYTLDLTQRQHFPPDFLNMEVSDRHWAWIRDRFLSWQGGWRENGGSEGPGVLVMHGHTIPAKAAHRTLVEQDRIREVLDRSGTNARICLDGGAGRGVAVAGAVLETEGVTLCVAPVAGYPA